jgi:hypothetical protein
MEPYSCLYSRRSLFFLIKSFTISLVIHFCFLSPWTVLVGTYCTVYTDTFQNNQSIYFWTGRQTPSLTRGSPPHFLYTVKGGGVNPRLNTGVGVLRCGPRIYFTCLETRGLLDRPYNFLTLKSTSQNKGNGLFTIITILIKSYSLDTNIKSLLEAVSSNPVTIKQDYMYVKFKTFSIHLLWKTDLFTLTLTLYIKKLWFFSSNFRFLLRERPQ